MLKCFSMYHLRIRTFSYIITTPLIITPKKFNNNFISSIFSQRNITYFLRSSRVILMWAQLWDLLIYITNRECDKSFTKFYLIKGILKPQSWKTGHCPDNACWNQDKESRVSLVRVNSTASAGVKSPGSYHCDFYFPSFATGFLFFFFSH